MKMNLPHVSLPVAKLKSWSLLATLALVLVGAIVFMLNVFNPLDIGPNGILLFFSLLYLLGVVVALMVIKLIRILLKRRFTVVTSMYLAAVIAFGPVMVLALSTLGQLSVLDVMLVIIFMALAVFYVLKRVR